MFNYHWCKVQIRKENEGKNCQGSGLHLKILEKLFRYNWKFISRDLDNKMRQKTPTAWQEVLCEIWFFFFRCSQLWGLLFLDCNATWPGMHFEETCYQQFPDISPILKVKPAESSATLVLVHIHETTDAFSHSRRQNTERVFDINLWEKIHRSAENW